jgi:hypothetical protein
MKHLPDDDHATTRDDSWYFGVEKPNVTEKQTKEVADDRVWIGCLAAVLIGAGILLVIASSTAPGASISGSPFTV